tara:strand:- start:284 stop:448 length:165 start_codon:yes stop_codon:yes gene_type:complete
VVVALTETPQAALVGQGAVETGVRLVLLVRQTQVVAVVVRTLVVALVAMAVPVS